jgi:anti-sigma factor RsiW
MSSDPTTCRELVELATEYLDLALPEAERQNFEQHLSRCIDCRHYLGQLRRTIASTGSLRDPGVAPEQRAALLGLFQRWRSGLTDSDLGAA